MKKKNIWIKRRIEKYRRIKKMDKRMKKKNRWIKRRT